MVYQDEYGDYVYQDEFQDTKLAKKISDKLQSFAKSLAKSREGRRAILDAIKEVVESYGHDDDSDGHDDDSDKSDNEDHYDDPDASNFTTRTDASRYQTAVLTDDYKPYEGHKEFKRTHPDLYICELPRRSQTQRHSNEKDCYWRLFDSDEQAYLLHALRCKGALPGGRGNSRSYKAVDIYLGWAIPDFLPMVIERP